MKRLAFFLALLLLWLLLTWSLDWQEVLVGIVVCVALGAVLGSMYGQRVAHIFEARRWFYFLLYVPYFIYYCLKANLDVAYRVIHPDLPIRPGIVKVTTSLKTDMAKTFLANSITLTPGTLTVDIEDQDLFVHWINIGTDDPDERTEVIVRRFEGLLARIFE